MSKPKAVVLLSGGLDSATVLAMAKARGFDCYTIGFDYGQKHNSELQAAHRVAEALGDHPHKLIRLDLGSIGGSALTSDEIDVPVGGVAEGGIPVTYVPARNTVFLSIALGYGEVIGATHLFIGANAVDYSGYPDCRRTTMDALQNALSLGTDKQFEIATPLMWIDKAQTWEMASQLGGDELVQLVTENTHTCYVGDRSRRHDRGYGCGECPACDLREKGFTKWRKECGDV